MSDRIRGFMERSTGFTPHSRRFAIYLGLLTCTGCVSTNGDIAPGFSGMAAAGPASYLAVNDRKTPRDPGYRFSLVDASRGERFMISPLQLGGVADAGQPSDLEAVCAIPGREAEFLAAESGFYQGNFGRLMHVRLQGMTTGERRLELINQTTFRDRPSTADGSTPKFDEIEGLVCFDHDDRLMIAYCERGSGPTRGEIHWGSLDLATLTFSAQGAAELMPPPSIDNRDCSELYIDERTESTVSIVAVATFDQDDDSGPFRSMVYRAGDLRLEAATGAWSFSSQNSAAIYEVEGMKIEALAGGPDGRSRYAFGTDDEDFGGVWRPLGVIEPGTKDP